jgi:hypothetical protein
VRRLSAPSRPAKEADTLACIAWTHPQAKGTSGEHWMPDWIAKANIDHFKKLLETEKDPRKRAVIKRELAEEEGKLAALLKEQGREKNDG